MLFFSVCVEDRVPNKHNIGSGSWRGKRQGAHEQEEEVVASRETARDDCEGQSRNRANQNQFFWISILPVVHGVLNVAAEEQWHDRLGLVRPS